MRGFLALLSIILIFILSNCGQQPITEITDIHEAVRLNSLSKVKQSIKLGANINTLRQGRSSPIYYAALKNNIEIVKFLLESGADVNAGLNEPLYAAVWKSNIDLMKLPLDKGARIDAGLRAAASQGNQEYVELILSYSTQSNNSQQDVLNLALFHTAYSGNIELAKWLLEQGASIHTHTVKNTEFVSSLDNRTPLSVAAERGHFEMVKLFYENGVHLIGAFHGAVQSNHLQIAEFAIKNGLDIAQEEQYYPNLFYDTAKNSNPKMMELLLNNGIDLQHHINTNGLPLHINDGGNIETVKVILEHPTFSKNNNPVIQQALETSLLWEYTDAVKFLLGYDKGIQIPEWHLNEYLFHSVQKGFFDQVKLLVELGGNIHFIQPKGLPDFPSKMNGAYISEGNLVHIAIQYGHMDILEYLVENGVDINHPLSDGTTPLISAVILNDIDFVRYLLQYRVDTSPKDMHGKTALDYANDHQNHEIIDLLQTNNSQEKP